jgi:hypothetical protein
MLIGAREINSTNGFRPLKIRPGDPYPLCDAHQGQREIIRAELFLGKDPGLDVA